MTYKIEKNVPMPQTHASLIKYPFNEMEVGDSFLADDHRVRNAASRWGLQNGVRLTVRKEGDKYRVWRIE